MNTLLWSFQEGRPWTADGSMWKGDVEGVIMIVWILVWCLWGLGKEEGWWWWDVEKERHRWGNISLWILVWYFPMVGVAQGCLVDWSYWHQVIIVLTIVELRPPSQSFRLDLQACTYHMSNNKLVNVYDTNPWKM